ncbi:hypothetical protein [Curvibacter sp. PAE-UM]|uniref:hypothetical protein n=1 Tax=Curvibacter sp. PAE-UM TaxID=1714344 RepID=UPI00070C8827|nr:hypothetical protein [Curvibacter sp. PAE-UM]KRH99217.1 hypothetical protein AO057_07095 [Curvibacter sp. PAE-UM]
MLKFKPRQKARVGDFRLLRGIPFETQIARLKRHVRALERRMAGDPVIRKFGMKNRSRARAALVSC